MYCININKLIKLIKSCECISSSSQRTTLHVQNHVKGLKLLRILRLKFKKSECLKGSRPADIFALIKNHGKAKTGTKDITRIDDGLLKAKTIQTRKTSV